VKKVHFLLLTFALAAFARDPGSLLQRIPSRLPARANPVASSGDAARAGRKLFSRQCASCHGPMGEGLGKAPPLASAAVRNASPAALFWVLRNGSMKRGMPSFAHLPEPQRWQIVTYLQTGDIQSPLRKRNITPAVPPR
jgi:mono/diheme cytochrome c family protein